jgi:hypothetical protein
MDDQSSISVRDRIFLFPVASRPALGSTQPPMPVIQGLMYIFGCVCPEIKILGIKGSGFHEIHMLCLNSICENNWYNDDMLSVSLNYTAQPLYLDSRRASCINETHLFNAAAPQGFIHIPGLVSSVLLFSSL